MKVYCDESPAGMGKTRRSIRNICNNTCKALFITERKSSFHELEADINEAATEFGTRPLIRHIHGDMEGISRSVVSEIEDLPQRYAGLEHVIVIATHAALLRSDFRDFSGWQIIIDEVPAFLDFEEKRTHLDADFFKKNYQLTHVIDRLHAVTLAQVGMGISVADVGADESHAHLRNFHARVIEASRPDSKRAVLVNMAQWDEMSDGSVNWCWASVFSLRTLEAFDRVELLGNRFRRDIGSILTQFLDDGDVEWEIMPPLLETRTFKSRPVNIYYFSNRSSSKSFFGSQAGQAALKVVGDYLGSILPKGKTIWTANQTANRGTPTPRALLGLPDDNYLTPKQAGTNQYMGVNSAVAIYSAKPSSNMRSFLSSLSIDAQAWTSSVEYEVILQFMTRTSVRATDDDRPVDLWVFDRDQAKYLKDYFDGLPHTQATMECVSTSINLQPSSKGGRRKTVRTPEEQESWNAEKRQKDAARKRKERAKKLKIQDSNNKGK